MKPRLISFVELQVGDLIQKKYDLAKDSVVALVVQLPFVQRDEKSLFRILVIESQHIREIGRVYDSIGNGATKDMILLSRVDEK